MPWPPSCHPGTRRPRGSGSPSREVQIPGVVRGQRRQRPGRIREEVLVAGGERVPPVGDVLLRLPARRPDPLGLLGGEVAGALGTLELVLVLVVPVASRQ